MLAAAGLGVWDGFGGGPLTTKLAWLGAALLLGLAGVAVRLHELGAWAFSNDEAWVALCTRVEGLRAFSLAIATTPVAWATLLKGATLVQPASEASLRAVPFVFGCLTLWVAYRAGSRFAGHRLGGILALAAVAFDPLSIAYAKTLKQYTAEAFLCVLAIDRAVVFSESGARRDLVLLTAVLTLGLCFANAQLFVAPPVLAVLLLDATWRRDARSVRALLIATAIVGIWDAVYYAVVMARSLPVASDRYWAHQLYLPPTVQAARLVWERLSWTLTPALGARGAVAGMLCLALACVLRHRWAASLTLVLLVLEVSGVSMLRRLPFSQPRLLLFLTTALAVYGAAAVAFVVVRAWSRPALGVIATVGLALVAGDFVRAHQWRTLGQTTHVEDAGPLVRLVERDRKPEDRVLLHQKALFVFGYYQQATPILDPLPTVAIRWVPRLGDDRIVLVNDLTLAAKAAAALRTSPRVWVLTSRQRGGAEKHMREQLSRLGSIAREDRRRGALLLLLTSTSRPTRS